MAFYEGIDEEIYEGGDHYVPMQQFRLNKFVPTVKTTPVTSPTSTSYGIPTIYPYGVRGGEGDYQGGGKWGNLDLSKSKTFTKDVWSEWGPGKGGWKKQEVTGFYNPKLGNYQTFEGKNINHLGIEVPTIAGALFDKNFGKGPQVGDIKGTFTDGWDSGWENIKEGWDEEKDKWSGVLGIDKAKAFFKGKKDKENIDFIDEKIGDTDPADVGTTTTTNQNQTGGGDGYTGDPRGDHAGIDYSGANYGPHKDSWSGGSGNQGTTPGAGLHADYNQGGRVGYKRGRVVDPGGYAGDEEGGIVEWLKSKMGIESETNPTMFGTQDSLLNRGSIDQLKNAIKSYEAMMHMGELDEEQLADYELKLAQLQALEEGAQSKADGGIVGFKYGGLASIL